MIKIKNYSFLIFVLFFTWNGLFSQIISPFNNIKINESTEDYSFIVSGHFHGASTNASTFPASSLLSNIDTLNSLNSSFLISLGDMFIDVNEVYIRHYQKSLFNKLKMPLFNVVGNHDVSNGNIYAKVYGKTFFTFKISNELFVFLDTEMDDGDIKNEQLDFFKNVLASAKDDRIKNVFIFSHRPVWAQQKKYAHLFKGNTRALFLSKNFEGQVLPLITELSKKKNTYWLSGSMGNGIASFFCDKDDNAKITYMQTAIRDLPRDAVLKVDVKNGKVFFSGIAFASQKLQPIETYNLEFWNKSSASEPAFNIRLLPYLTLKTLKHSSFWIGMVFTLFLALFIYLLFIKKWRKRK